jgi:hypothetical protein
LHGVQRWGFGVANRIFVDRLLREDLAQLSIRIWCIVNPRTTAPPLFRSNLVHVEQIDDFDRGANGVSFVSEFSMNRQPNCLSELNRRWEWKKNIFKLEKSAVRIVARQDEKSLLIVLVAWNCRV